MPQDRRSATNLKQNTKTGFSCESCGWTKLLNHDTFFIF